MRAPKSITLLGPNGKAYKFRCAGVLRGRTVDPVLPKRFDDTPNEDRSPRSMAWWNVPFIVACCYDDATFRKAWPGGVRYDVRCLDGGAWDRSTWWGSFSTLDEASRCNGYRDEPKNHFPRA